MGEIAKHVFVLTQLVATLAKMHTRGAAEERKLADYIVEQAEAIGDRILADLRKG